MKYFSLTIVTALRTKTIGKWRHSNIFFFFILDFNLNAKRFRFISICRIINFMNLSPLYHFTILLNSNNRRKLNWSKAIQIFLYALNFEYKYNIFLTYITNERNDLEISWSAIQWIAIKHMKHLNIEENGFSMTSQRLVNVFFFSFFCFILI